MIRLFTANETSFTHNKWILSEAISATVTEDLTGMFDLDLEYPLLDTKGIAVNLVRGNIIKCPISTTDERGEQLFKIRTVTTNTTSNRVNVYAQCIARSELARNFVLGIEVAAGKTRKEAGQILLNGCVEDKGYYIGSLDTNTNTSINLGLDDDGNVIDYLDIAYISPLEGFLGTSSIISAYGGEIVYNNKEINVVDARGADHSFTISSGKNLQELQQEISDMEDDFATALIMKSGDDVHLPNNEIILSGNAAILGNYYKLVTCSDVTLVETTTTADAAEALEIVYAQLRELAQKQFNNGIDQLTINNTINFIQLANTEEYKDYAILEKCELGNNVIIKYVKTGLEATGRVVKIKFNVLKNKIEEVEIGKRTTSITDTITATSITIADTIETLNGTTATLKNQGTKISAVVSSNDGGMTWVLDKEAFTVGCTDASGANVVIDINGLTVNDGKFFLKKNGNIVFKVNTNGKCTSVNGFAIEDGGDECCYIDNTGIEMTNANGYVGKIQVHPTKTALQIPDDLYIGSGLRVTDTSYFYSSLYISDDLDVAGNLDVTGSKPCLIHTQNYGKRRITAYETAEYYFGDIGEGTITDGECIIAFEDVFLECINTSVAYQVFTQTYNGLITKIERYENYFILYGTDNTTFGWEVKAKRINYENVRLEEKIEVEE